MGSNDDKLRKRSPIGVAPLPLPGRSLRDQLLDLTLGKWAPWALASLVFLLVGALELATWLLPSTRGPEFALLFSLFGLMCGAVALRLWRRVKPKIADSELGLDGELSVAEGLADLRTKGYRVLHDLPSDRGNVDHVLVGPCGILTVETKTRSKPARGPAGVQYDGEHVTVGGLRQDRDPVAQAKAQARQLQDLSFRLTGRRVPVRAVVLYPGWYVTKSEGIKPEVWVLNPKLLEAYLDHEDAVLSEEDIEFVFGRLADWLREQPV